ncbi:MAG: hypothetical protein E7622_02425 [Ruminococcaceae bacterium]|nr:hypothetical protein [Oscillospiraceae bacterium]
MADMEKSLVDILLDEEDMSDVVLYDNDDKAVRFEQIAIIPEVIDGQTRLYAILQPIDTLDGVAEDEALLFRVFTEENDGEDNVVFEDDFDIAEAVFEHYYKLIEE